MVFTLFYRNSGVQAELQTERTTWQCNLTRRQPRKAAHSVSPQQILVSHGGSLPLLYLLVKLNILAVTDIRNTELRKTVHFIKEW